MSRAIGNESMLSSEDHRIIAGAAASEDIDPAALSAVVEVESGGQVFARVGGRMEPLIRWEGHYFDRLCDASVRARAREAGLASPRAGAVANPPTQAARWEMLRRAAALDHEAAYQSVSWGVGQVMGAHWQGLGYASVDALASDARSGLEGQLRLMLRFLRHAGLLPALRQRDWTGFARGYNGPSYRRNGYDCKLQRAYAACSRSGEPARLQDPAAGGGKAAPDGRSEREARAAVRGAHEESTVAAGGPCSRTRLSRLLAFLL